MRSITIPRIDIEDLLPLDSHIIAVGSRGTLTFPRYSTYCPIKDEPNELNEAACDIYYLGECYFENGTIEGIDA